MANRPLSFQDAKEAYQSKVPRMRQEFADRLWALHRHANETEYLFTAKYREEACSVAKDEMRRRHQVAAECLRAVQSGAEPHDSPTLQSWYTSLFAHVEAANDSFSDLKNSFDLVLQRIGQHDPPARDRFVKELGEVQVQAGKEAVADLRIHRAKDDKPQYNFHGPMGAVQIGDHNTAEVNQTVNQPAAELIRALAALQESVRQNAETDGAAAVAVVESARAEVGAHGFTERARAMLVRLPALVPFAADIGPAYELVRAAAGALGVPLPDLPKTP